MSTKPATINITGPGIGVTLFAVFLTLKLTGTIDWSWWWVTCPLWAVPALILGVGGVVLAVLGVAWVIASIADWASK